MRLLATAVALSLAALTLRAQDPAPPKFELLSTSGQTTFHIGERIPLTLRFTGPPSTYDIILYNFGRTDPLHLDRFTIEPSSGWTDSLAEYAAFQGGGCCGAKQAGVLSADPKVLQINLNEWVRFDDPGTYTITIATRRVHLSSTKDPSMLSILDMSDSAYSLHSNTLQIRIIPATAAWQKQTLERALHEFNRPQETSGEQSPAFNNAIADLRFLATSEALSFLAAHLSDDHLDIGRDMQAGLVGLSRSMRDQAFAVMNHLIDDPSFPVSEDFLDTFPSMHLAEVDPPPPDVFTGEFDPDHFRALYQAHEVAAEKFYDAAWEETARALPRKAEPARSHTGEALLKRRPAHPSTEATAQIGALLRESFGHLSHAEQATLLTDSWDLIGSRSLLPELRTLAEVTASPHSAGMPAFMDPDQGVRAIALERWYEFEPEAATREILHQIGSAAPGLTAAEIDYLPEGQTFPQFEQTWAKAFTASENFQDSDALGALLNRFGTGTATHQIEALILKEREVLDGNRKGPAFAYLLRFDPDFARRLIAEEDAVLPGDGNRYTAVSLNNIAQFRHPPELTDIALTALNSPNPQAVSDAVSYLGTYGDDRARKTLLDLYLASTESPVADDTKPDGDHLSQTDTQKEVLTNLVRALLAGQGWVADPALIATVKKHCTSPDLCKEVEDLSVQERRVNISYWQHNVDIYLGQQRIPSFTLFEAKLDQFPKGTTFILEGVSSPDSGGQPQLQGTLTELFARHGMILQTPGK